MAQANGKKFNAGKPRVDLVSSAVIVEMGKVLGFGTIKYSENNWLKGVSYQDLYASTQRHILAWHQGVELDAESNLSHISHALVNLMMILHFQLNEQTHLDNRPYKGTNNGTS